MTLIAVISTSFLIFTWESLRACLCLLPLPPSLHPTHSASLSIHSLAVHYCSALCVPCVPGIPDLLMLLVQLTQSMMNERLSYISDLECVVLEVKMVEGHGMTIDVILVNGTLNEGETMVICGLQGPIVTTIRALLTPPAMQELRVKSEYVHHKAVKAAMGVKISAQGLEHAIAGSQLLVFRPNRGPSLDELKDEVQGDLATILSKVDKSGQGVCVQASTLGSLEALLTFLGDMKVPRISHTAHPARAPRTR